MTYKPKGNCPHCGYGIDPGICPECGKAVSAEELDVVAARRQHQHRIRIMARWSALLIIVIGGYYYVRDIDFAAKVPTNWLLKWHAPWTSKEVWSRFCHGKLSATDAGRFLDQQVAISSLTATSPHPANESVCLRISIGSTGFFQYTQWDPFVIDWNVAIDGEAAPCRAESHEVAGDFWTQYLCVRVGPMPVGMHDVVVSGTCTLAKNDRGSGVRICGEGRAPPRFDFTRSVKVVIEPGSVEHFARPVWSDELAGQVRDLVKARALGEPGEKVSLLFISCQPLPVSLAGHVAVRSTDDEKYASVSRRLAFPAGTPNFLQVWNADLGIEGAHSVDVRFVPDAKLALDSGFAEYFAGILQWSAVPVSMPDQADPKGEPSEDARSPTIVGQEGMMTKP